MAKLRMSRQSLLPAMARHVLKNGISGVSLRPLARAAGTSDRMLIYHFGNRQGVIEALLEYLGRQFAEGLEQALPADRATTRFEMVSRIMAATGSAQMEPFLTLWWELVAEAARGDAAFRASTQSIMQLMLDWLQAHMPADDPDPLGGAKLVLTLVEGAQMLDAVGCAPIGRAALESLDD